jgi:hypothetical protein
VALNRLELHDTSASNEGVIAVATSSPLKELSVSNTKIDDGIIDHLAAIETLGHVIFRNTGVTDIGVRSLKSQRPMITVVHSTP